MPMHLRHRLITRDHRHAGSAPRGLVLCGSKRQAGSVWLITKLLWPQSAMGDRHSFSHANVAGPSSSQLEDIRASITENAGQIAACAERIVAAIVPAASERSVSEDRNFPET
ncbi:hypothetical protein EMIHUDRAFT_235005 [Emiliania huxleyi CCMP1516]|uniref:Uncharacterized protein n=2 Tax=Emiliania huxleyi TaxID=2903 RepID=A0A0D3JXJ3_EMIH1|nr:hypothetical protein EMIHUDRAFT_235005 [Emiliania huxleyi CCMP1516]EOD28228.1 hypothetical protein EMIHUDRAFT_235005 [Emiliania huxleyi CCMP1516]|eukprot:XP_005780657.1 hypothetical protein EMIHUDRAFT_235005 [Emiliania huxleyi CCMP1516]